MDRLFYGCSSLGILPNISVWDLSKVDSMQQIFFHCSILFLPTVTNWNIPKIKNIDINEYFGISENQSISIPISLNNEVKSIFSNEGKNSSLEDKNYLEKIKDDKNEENNEENNEINDFTNLNEAFDKKENLNEFYDNFYN